MVCTHPSPSSIRSHHAISHNCRIKPWCKAGKIFVILAFIFLGSLTAYGQDQAKMDGFNKKIEALTREMAACGPDINCLQRVGREMQKLSAEMQSLAEGIAPGQGMPWAPSPGNPPGAVPGNLGPMTRVPVSVKVVNFIEMKNLARGENGRVYTAKYYVLEYEVEGEGSLHYAKDFERFSLKAPNVSPWASERPKNFRIKRASGYTQGTRLDHSTGRRVLRRYPNGPVTGLDSMHKNFVFRAVHPALEGTPFNVDFQPVYVTATVRSGKDTYPTTYEPTYLDAVRCKVSNPDDFTITPDMIREGLETGRLQKVFKWQEETDDLGGYKKNILTVTMRFRANPGVLAVSPKEEFRSSGPDDRDRFSPPSRTYTLKNTGGSPIEFKVSKGKTWLKLSAADGNLAPGESTKVTISIHTNAKDMEPGTYHDQIQISNTTNHKGDTTLKASLEVGEMQTWEVKLTGQETDDLGGKLMAVKLQDVWKQVTVHYGVRFDYKLTARFTIKKRKGGWAYQSGKITFGHVGVSDNFDPIVFFIKPIKCLNCQDVPNLKGTPLKGEVVGKTVRLFWPEVVTRAIVSNKLKLQFESKEESHQGYSDNFFESSDFFQRTGTHQVPLQNGAKEFKVVKESSKHRFRLDKRKPINISYRYFMKKVD